MDMLKNWTKHYHLTPWEQAHEAQCLSRNHLNTSPQVTSLALSYKPVSVTSKINEKLQAYSY